VSESTDGLRERAHEDVEHPHGEALANADPVGGLAEEPSVPADATREEQA
jgi:hypothetical protein